MRSSFTEIKIMQNRNRNFYVITGGPCVGKTTLINELLRLGFDTVEEDARKIIKEEVETGRDGVPWKDKERYAKLMLEASAESYDKIASDNNSGIVFFDRGILDAVCYMDMQNMPLTEEARHAAENRPYCKKVFILPPWKEIYETDSERKQDWNEAESTFSKMRDTYLKFNYNVIEVPIGSAEARAQFILQQVNIT